MKQKSINYKNRSLVRIFTNFAIFAGQKQGQHGELSADERGHGPRL